MTNTANLSAAIQDLTPLDLRLLTKLFLELSIKVAEKGQLGLGRVYQELGVCFLGDISRRKFEMQRLEAFANGDPAPPPADEDLEGN